MSRSYQEPQGQYNYSDFDSETGELLEEAYLREKAGWTQSELESTEEEEDAEDEGAKGKKKEPAYYQSAFGDFMGGRERAREAEVEKELGAARARARRPQRPKFPEKLYVVLVGYGKKGDEIYEVGTSEELGRDEELTADRYQLIEGGEYGCFFEVAYKETEHGDALHFGKVKLYELRLRTSRVDRVQYKAKEVQLRTGEGQVLRQKALLDVDGEESDSEDESSCGSP